MRFRVEFEPRFDYGRGDARDVACTTRAPSSRRRAHARASHSPVTLARDERRRRAASSRSRAGESVTFVLEPIERGDAPRAYSRGGDARALRATRSRSGADWLGAVALPRPLARDGAPLGAHAEAAHLPADRRDRRRADDEPARAARRRAATGTTATRGSATPRSRSTRCCGSGSRRRPSAFMGWLTRPRPRARQPRRDGPAPDHVRHRRPRRRSRRSARPPRGLPRLGARCGSATAPPTSSSSTSTAS